jgi:hypothetical protein
METHRNFECSGTMNITVKKVCHPDGVEATYLTYTFKGEQVELHGMLQTGMISKSGDMNFLFFHDLEMDVDASVQMAGCISERHLANTVVGDEAGALTEEENMFGGKLVI